MKTYDLKIQMELSLPNGEGQLDLFINNVNTSIEPKDSDPRKECSYEILPGMPAHEYRLFVRNYMHSDDLEWSEYVDEIKSLYDLNNEDIYRVVEELKLIKKDII